MDKSAGILQDFRDLVDLMSHGEHRTDAALRFLLKGWLVRVGTDPIVYAATPLAGKMLAGLSFNSESTYREYDIDVWTSQLAGGGFGWDYTIDHAHHSLRRDATCGSQQQAITAGRLHARETIDAWRASESGS